MLTMKKIPKEGIFLLSFAFLLIIFDILSTLLDLETLLENIEPPFLAAAGSILLFLALVLVPLMIIKKKLYKSTKEEGAARDKKKSSRLSNALVTILLWFLISSLGLPRLTIDNLMGRSLMLLLIAGGILLYYVRKENRRANHQSKDFDQTQ